jgi:hypothetical protein
MARALRNEIHDYLTSCEALLSLLGGANLNSPLTSDERLIVQYYVEELAKALPIVSSQLHPEDEKKAVRDMLAPLQ